MRAPALLTASIAAVLTYLLGVAGPSFAAKEEKASQLYEDALARFEKNDTAGAIVQLKNALQNDPQMLSAYLLLGRVYLLSARPDAAQDALERAQRLGAHPSEVALPLAQALLKLGRAKELLERFPLDSVAAGDRPDLLVVRGLAYRQLGDVNAAVRCFEEARSLNPRFVPALLTHADLLSQRGNGIQAMKLVDTALAVAPADAAVWQMKATIDQFAGNLPAAIEHYGHALSLNPRQTDARVGRVSLLLALGRDEEAAADIEYFKREKEQDPRATYMRSVFLARKGDAAGTREAMAEITQAVDPVPMTILAAQAPELLFVGGLAHHGLGEFEKARGYLERYLQVQPRNIGARKLLGSIKLAQRDYGGATAVLDPALRYAPNDPQVLSLLASAYMGRGRHQLAAGYLERALELNRSAPDIEAQSGLNLLQSGKADAGIRHLQSAFDKQPSPSIGAALTLLYIQRGDNTRAVAIAEKLARGQPSNVNALNLLGVARVAARDYAGGRKAYEQALAIHSGFAAARLNLGKLDALQGNQAAARERFLGILSDRPQDVGAMYELAKLEQSGGRVNEAVQWLEKLRAVDRRNIAGAVKLVDLYLRQGEIQKALEVAKDIDTFSSDNIESVATLARAQAAAGNDREAQAALAKMGQLAGPNPEVHYRVALLQLGAKNPNGAARSLEAALANKPDFLQAEVLLAEIEITRGRIEQAAARAKSLARRYPASSIGARLQADVDMAQGRTAAALSGYEVALSKEPTTASAVRLYQAYARSGDPAKGVELMEGWVGKNPRDLMALRALAEGYLRAGDLPAARGRYEAIRRETGEDPQVLNNLANILAQQGDSKALDLAERARQLAPEDPSIQDTVGWLLVQRGQLDAGLKHLREASHRDPSNPEIRYHLGAALARAGRREEAKLELTNALRDPGAFAGVDDARTLLQQLSSR